MTSPRHWFERHTSSVLHSRWDVTASHQCSKTPKGSERQHPATHPPTHERARSLGQTGLPIRRRESLWALQPAERSSLHLRRKHHRGLHFSVSLCAHVRSLINQACSSSKLQHPTTQSCVAQDRRLAILAKKKWKKDSTCFQLFKQKTVEKTVIAYI